MNEARRTEIRLTLDGADISEDINKYLISLTYTDNEEDKTDDLQIAIDDRENIWIGSWLNSPNIKGMEMSAVIMQKNWNSDGKSNVLDCGVFEVDSIESSGPPGAVSIKATSIPHSSTIRTQKNNRAWEKMSLSALAKEIAQKNGMKCMFESSYDPFFERKEQIQESDIVFLQKNCKSAGISLKVTAKIIVLFDAAEYEKKEAVRDIVRGQSNISRYSFSTNFHDSAYSGCTITYTDPLTQKTFSGTFNAPGGSGSGQELKINEKVTSDAEALKLAEKRLREKNRQEFSASFNLAGDVGLVAGVTTMVKGYGAFEGKYIVETATHAVSASGYKTDVKLRRVLEGY